LSRGASPDDAKDLRQEVFLHIIRSATTFDSKKGTFRVWLFRIATNALADLLRKDGELRPVPLTECECETAQPPPSQIIMDLDRFIYELAPEFQETLVLSAIAGLSTHEIAEVLNISSQTVYTRMHRARAELKRKLAPPHGNDVAVMRPGGGGN
jgi:RNA polymerase sigma-70 factor (ECF subfamily)